MLTDQRRSGMLRGNLAISEDDWTKDRTKIWNETGGPGTETRQSIGTRKIIEGLHRRLRFRNVRYSVVARRRPPLFPSAERSCRLFAPTLLLFKISSFTVHPRLARCRPSLLCHSSISRGLARLSSPRRAPPKSGEEKFNNPARRNPRTDN